MKNISVVIPFYNGHQYLNRLLKSLPRNIPIIVVDDLSDTPLRTNDIETGISNIQIIRRGSRGYFAGAVNQGIQACTTDVLVLNQDVWFEDGGWFGLIDQYRDRYAMIGERVRGDHPTFGATGYIHGTFMFLRRDALDSVGLLSDLYPLWGCTAEWQLRAARKGFAVLPLKEILGFHHERPRNAAYGSSIKTILEKEPHRQELFLRTPPLVSVIVPCYNYGRYLQDCINSLIGGPTVMGEMSPQSLQSFEIIIVNDASTDNSAETINRLAKIEQGIRAYHLAKNVGTARALNYGIERAVGKYITFLSADDMRESFSLEALVKCCEENSHSIAYDDIWLCYGHQRIKKWVMEEYDFEELLLKNQIHAGIMYPKTAWVEAGGYPAIMHDGREDWAFNIALGIKGWCGVHVNQLGYLYRREGQNRTETNTSGYHLDYFRDKVRSLFPKIYGGQRPMACCGKGSNKNRSNTAPRELRSLVMDNGARMVNTVGTQGMTKLEYTGKQMTATWSGSATGAIYYFGADKPRGWVDKRDVGERGKSGFLGMKGKSAGDWLFQVATDEPAPVEEVVEEVIEEVIEEPVLAGVAGPSGNAVMTGTLSAVESKVLAVDIPNITDMNVVEIKALQLTREQLLEVYRVELAGRARKGLISYLEERLVEDV